MLFLSENTQETPIRHEMDILTETVNIVHDMMNLNESHIKYEYQSLTTLNEDVDSKLKKVKDFVLSIIEKVKTALKRVTDYIKNLINRFTKGKKSKTVNTADNTPVDGSASKTNPDHAVTFYLLSENIGKVLKEVHACVSDLNRAIDKVLNSPLNTNTSKYISGLEDDVVAVKEMVDSLESDNTKKYTEAEVSVFFKTLSSFDDPVNKAVSQLDKIKANLDKTDDMRQVMDLQAAIKSVNISSMIVFKLCTYLSGDM